MKPQRKPMVLKLGDDYMVSIFGRIMACRLIQPTEKGFNLLNLDTNKCILRHHHYPCKKMSTERETVFWVNEVIAIKKLPYAYKRTS